MLSELPNNSGVGPIVKVSSIFGSIFGLPRGFRSIVNGERQGGVHVSRTSGTEAAGCPHACLSRPPRYFFYLNGRISRVNLDSDKTRGQDETGPRERATERGRDSPGLISTTNQSQNGTEYEAEVRSLEGKDNLGSSRTSRETKEASNTGSNVPPSLYCIE